MNQVSENSPLPFIPNLYHSALNLKYHRGIQTHDHFIINYQKSQYSSSTGRETKQTLFHLSRIWSHTVAFCQLCLCNWKEEHLPLFNRLFSDRAWVCSTLPSFPLVMEKSHSYSEIANQPGNHHTEIAPMKIQQCYI